MLSTIGAIISSAGLRLASSGVADRITIAENSAPVARIVSPASAAPCSSRLPADGVGRDRRQPRQHRLPFVLERRDQFRQAAERADGNRPLSDALDEMRRRPSA